ncbi:hypothetical protein KEM52_002339, partial [Ascosphaera acerosa]
MLTHWQPALLPLTRPDGRHSQRPSRYHYHRYCAHIARSRRGRQLGLLLVAALLATCIYLNFVLGGTVRRMHVLRTDPRSSAYGRTYAERPVRGAGRISGPGLGHGLPPLAEQVKAQLTQSRDGFRASVQPGSVEEAEAGGAWAPQLHLVLRGKQRTLETCRTVASAAINGYAPAHMVLLDGRDDAWDPVARRRQPSAVHGVLRMLTATETETGEDEGADDRPLFADDDVVLVADADDTWFQLPAQVLLRRFFETLRAANENLAARHGYIDATEAITPADQHLHGRSPATIPPQPPFSPVRLGSGSNALVQKYTARILFSASKTCNVPSRGRGGRVASDRLPACAAVPFSPLRPDTYDAHTDVPGDRHSFRPRWLGSGMVMGIVADMRALYQRAAEEVEQASRGRGRQCVGCATEEQHVLSNIFGEQEYLREVDRRRNAIGFFKRVGEVLGLIPRVDLRGVRLDSRRRHHRKNHHTSHRDDHTRKGAAAAPAAAAAAAVVDPADLVRRDFGISLDYTSSLFLPLLADERDTQWIRYDDSRAIVETQRTRRLPFYAKLGLPEDVAALGRPFRSGKSVGWEGAGRERETGADQKHPRGRHPQAPSWPALSLLTNIPSFRVPAVLHFDVPVPEHQREEKWRRIWFASGLSPWMRQ